MDRKRVDYIDIAKGLGMLAIVWGHIILIKYSCRVVYGFHIPIFFILSGMCFNHKKYSTVGEFIRRRVKTLLVPYVVFSLVTWLIYILGVWLTHNDTMKNCWYYLLQTVLAQGSDGYLGHNVALWFVPCLFVVEVLYYFIAKLSDGINIIICLLCMIVGVMLSRRFYNYTILPWSIDSALVAIPFYALGNLTVKRLTHEKIINLVDRNIFKFVLVSTILSIIYLINVQNNGYVSMGHNNLGKHVWLFFINAICGSLSIILFSIVLGSFLKRSWIQKPILFVRWLGENSFNVMAVHMPLRTIILVFLGLFLHINLGKMLSTNISFSLVVYFATIIVTSMVIQLISKGKDLFAGKKV